MATTATLFVTTVYRSALLKRGADEMRRTLSRSADALAAADHAGQAWCRNEGYPGYTSYASLNDLPRRDPAFQDLEDALEPHVATFVKLLDLDLGGRKLGLDSLWVNVLAPGGHHAAHIHPQSIVSGTYYVSLPHGAAGLKFEDPRLPLMMAAPPRKARASPQNRSFVEMHPKPGDVLLWESYLRHEVPVNNGKSDRISVSFNYGWA